MNYPKFILNDKFEPQENDLILLIFINDKERLFLDSKPLEKIDIIAPKEPGGSTTLFRGSLYDKKNCMVRACRLDKKHSSPHEAIKEVISKHIDISKDEDIKRIVVLIAPEREPQWIKSIAEGAILGGYRYDDYLSKKPELPSIVCIYDKKLNKEEKEAIANAQKGFHWVNAARDLLNAPPVAINPHSLSKKFQELGKKAGLKVTVWDEKRIRREKMNGLLAVGSGSNYPPRLVIGEYRPKGAKKHLVLVGKGVTFDTGGYCLKPSEAQIGMKFDMAGAAACFCAACAICEIGIPIRVTVIAPLCENAISSTAYKTTDIIVMRNGKSVEVDNTDAEGRLILADALDLALEKDPDWLIDMATLTGACVVALGDDIAGLMGQDDDLISSIKSSGEGVGELFWELPLHMPYTEKLKSDIADTKNAGKRWGGAITGALFLKRFVPDDVAWVHADIAGPGVKEEPLGHLGKGSKGFGIKTLIELARRLID